MKFPTMVYRCPGAHSCQGGTFDFLGVKSQVDVDAAIAAGWSVTLPEAMTKKYGAPMPAAAPVVEQEPEFEVLGDGEPPTRAELEKQAAELGIKFKKSITDDELNAKINEALEG